MAKIKLSIDLGIDDFHVAFSAEALGFKAAGAVGRKKISSSGLVKLAQEETIDLSVQDYSELSSTEPSAPTEQ